MTQLATIDSEKFSVLIDGYYHKPIALVNGELNKSRWAKSHNMLADPYTIPISEEFEACLQILYTVELQVFLLQSVEGDTLNFLGPNYSPLIDIFDDVVNLA